jgi:hypothetical protein
MAKTLLAILAVISAIIAIYGIGIVIGMKTAEARESWRMEVHYTVTDERICAYYAFDTEDACERAKDWFVAQAAWHGKNRYQCILESQCL